MRANPHHSVRVIRVHVDEYMAEFRSVFILLPPGVTISDMAGNGWTDGMPIELVMASMRNADVLVVGFLRVLA